MYFEKHYKSAIIESNLSNINKLVKLEQAFTVINEVFTSNPILGCVYRTYIFNHSP